MIDSKLCTVMNLSEAECINHRESVKIEFGFEDIIFNATHFSVTMNVTYVAQTGYYINYNDCLK